MNKTALYIVVALLALTAGAGAGYWQYKRLPEQTASAAPAAPTFWQASFKDVAGKPQALAQWRGKPLVVNYWATWCAPCREEMPDFDATAKALGDKATVVGIAIDNPEAVKKFLGELAISYPILVGEEDALGLMRAEGNHIGGLPYTVVYDKTGRKVAAHAGRLSRDKLNAFLKPLLQAEKVADTRQ
ncbi:TlpA family protein disulfide reductase [Chitinimonas sp.]|uniref:TlpA family protein disulfide reductase n=1 Tax=Chitinimonas sp. TaxID=1934313 RepID=UPI0035B082A2